MPAANQFTRYSVILAWLLLTMVSQRQSEAEPTPQFDVWSTYCSGPFGPA